MNVTVIVHRRMAYIAPIHEWRGELARPLTKKYWISGYTRKYQAKFAKCEFASDRVMERFWRKLDRTAFRERFILTIDGNVSTTELITLASKQVQRDNQFPIYGVHGLFHLESGAEIERERQLADYAVEDGDHFALILTWHDTAAYYIERYRDSEDVFAAIRSTSAQPPISDTEALRGQP